MSEATEDKESLARSHLPFRAEYCKTGRARCKKCSGPMEANSLKLANLTKSRFHDGYDASFYHVNCFFQIKRPSSVAEIRHFETLKYEDQKLLEKAVETKGLSVLGTNVEVSEKDEKSDGSKSKSKKGKKRGPLETDSNGSLVNYQDFMVEYAKSNRAKCNLCEEKIEKNAVRLGKLDYDAETHWKAGPVPRWFHVECFAKSMEQLEFFGQIEKIKDFGDLEEEDQEILKKKIKPLKIAPKILDGDSKKMKKEDEANSDAQKEEKLLKKQSDRFFAVREHVNTMKRKDVEYLLESMKQKSNFKASSMLIDMATDVLLFGPLSICPICKQRGGIELRGSSYICTRGLSEWEQCTYETREPKRGLPDIPEEIMEKYPYFREAYKFKGGARIFPSKFVKAVEQKEAEDNNIVQEGAPLDGLTFGVTSWKAVTIEKSKVQKKIATLGGKIQTALDKSLFVILSNEQELAKDSPKMEVARALNVPFVTADFILKVETKDDVVPQIKKCLIGNWDGDIEARFKKMNVKELKSNIKSRSAANVAKSIYKSGSVPKSQTLIVKDGTAVDPDSGYAEVGRVYRAGPHVYSVVLNCVDVTKDKNSFYKIQVIEHETKKEYFLFRAWGRIGCDVGGNSCKRMDSRNDAIENFEQLFKERTGNDFSTVAAGNFRRNHGSYFPVEMDYGDSKVKEEEPELKYSESSKLDKAVQELICFIFDIQRMQRAMKQFELDAEKMPLGKLSKKHISEAMATLKELESVLEVKPSEKPNKKKLIALTNKFYSHIPQSFGDGRVELIDSLKQVEDKNQMLTGLTEIEIAYSMVSTIDKTSEQLPVDQHYMQLNCAVSVLDTSGTEYTLIQDYVQKTHAVTHSNYKLKLRDIFKVQRDEDIKRFKDHKEKERALLWHGSRTTNFAGILSQGLRVAPPEAPTTGYMFGKGIYFADMSSKAANYCMTDPTNNVGLLLLCEVALGKMHEIFESDPNLPKGLPEGCDSVKGVGKSMTDPKTHTKIEDNLVVPIGKQVPNKRVKSQLLYNEFVVYQESQTMIRYIIQAEFIFRV